MRKTWVALLGLSATPLVHAGSTTALHSDLVFSGGIASGYFYSFSSPETVAENQDDFRVTDFIVEVSSEEGQNKGAPGALDFTGGIGLLREEISIFDGGVIGLTPPPVTADIQYGWITVRPTNMFTVEWGQLHTKLGYEVTPTFENPNVLHGALYTELPTYYPGARVTFNWQDMFNVFAEATNNTSLNGTNSWILGVNGTLAGFNYLLGYENVDDGFSLVDLVLGANIQGVKAAFEADYWFASERDLPPGATDDNGWGIGLWVAPTFQMFSVPVRLEYVNGGDTGLFSTPLGNTDSAFTVTVTPTYYFTNNAFVRAELAFISSDNDVFLNDDGELEDSNTSFNLQGGFVF